MALWDETEMKVAITGHKNGLGKELAAWFVGSKDEVSMGDVGTISNVINAISPAITGRYLK